MTQHIHLISVGKKVPCSKYLQTDTVCVLDQQTTISKRISTHFILFISHKELQSTPVFFIRIVIDWIQHAGKKKNGSGLDPKLTGSELLLTIRTQIVKEKQDLMGFLNPNKNRLRKTTDPDPK